MEKIINEDLRKAADRKSVAQARDTLSKIGKGDDKIDTSKMKIRPSDRDKNLIRAYRFKNNVPARVSDADVLKMINQGTPAKNKKEAAKLPKKSIMELPTNVPRLMKGANLMNPDKADLNKDGKLSSYEKARGTAIEKNIKKAKDGMLMSDRDKQVQEQKNKTQAKTMKEKVFNNPRISDQDIKMLNNIFNKNKISDQDMKTLKRFIK
tara:strand:+ start:208 stop:831 length:624 start_codon:yes stop_codon:yes gene_type:complete